MIDMHEHPARALRQKPRASLKLAVDLVPRAAPRAAFSAGNSGAIMAAALFGLRRLPGIDRPAFGLPIPTSKGASFLIDMGANAECKPLVPAAVRRDGRGLYAPGLRPELTHGRAAQQRRGGRQGHAAGAGDASRCCAASPFNFKGNVEGKDVFAGTGRCGRGRRLLRQRLAQDRLRVPATMILDMLRAELESSLRTKARRRAGHARLPGGAAQARL